MTIRRNPRTNLDQVLVSAGEVAGWSRERKFGANITVGTTFSVVSPMGGKYPFPKTTETISIVSSSVFDNGSPQGEGAGRLRIFGLDDNFNTLEEDILLNGTTPVITTNAFRRINRVSALVGGEYHDDDAAGTGDGTNRGTITGTNTTSSQLLFQIDIETCQTSQMIFTVPADKKMFIIAADISAASGKRSDFLVFVRPNADIIVSPFPSAHITGAVSGVVNPVVFSIESSVAIDPKTDLWIEARVDTTTAKVTATLEFALKDI